MFVEAALFGCVNRLVTDERQHTSFDRYLFQHLSRLGCSLSLLPLSEGSLAVSRWNLSGGVPSHVVLCSSVDEQNVETPTCRCCAFEIRRRAVWSSSRRAPLVGLGGRRRKIHGGCGDPTTLLRRATWADCAGVPGTIGESVFTHGHGPGLCCTRGGAKQAALSCFRRIGFELSREPLRVMRAIGWPTAGSAVRACLFLSSEYDGSERMTGIGWLSVRVSERLRAVCLPFSVLREASVRRGTESWDLVLPAGHPR